MNVLEDRERREVKRKEEAENGVIMRKPLSVNILHFSSSASAHFFVISQVYSPFCFLINKEGVAVV